MVGEVTGVDPLKIKIREGYEITEEHLILSCLCVETWIRTPKNQQDEYEHLHEIDADTENATTGIILNPGTGGASMVDTGHKHHISIKTKTALPEICLWRGLKKGDEVIILRFGGGTLHYVLERVGGLTNDSDEDGGKYE